MSLFIVDTRDAAFAAQAQASARRQFALHGHATVTAWDLGGWRLLHAAPIMGGPETLFARGDDLVAVAGTPIVDGLFGRAALERLLEPGLVPGLDTERIEGQFVAVVRRGGRTFLFSDFYGIFQLFHDAGERFFSTSQLAALDVLPRVSFDPQGLYEWAFGVVSIGDGSVFSELKMMGPERVVELTPTGAVSHAVARPLADWTPHDASPEELVQRNRDRLMRVAEAHVRAFGNDIFCPLSAGFDSRLMLAALRAAGAVPHVYVYGPPGGADVRIAQAIGAGEGFTVHWTDKQAAPIEPDAFSAQVERNFHELDGLPNFGNLFDNGVNAAARDARHAGGAIAVSGGGGEIYRDFFMLPDRPVSAWTLARAFSSRFLASDALPPFDAASYRRRIAAKWAAGLGSDDPDQPLARTRIEQALPRVRLRALFRWEVNAECRYGPYSLFFQQPSLLAEAGRVPTRLKQAGRFQAMMIDAIDPALARHVSGYGHHFAGPPGLRYRLEEAATRYRPAWLRERTYALKRRRGTMTDEHGGLLSPEYMGRVLDPQLPIMRRWFEVDAINDAGLWRRLACLEYLAQRLGSRLAG